MGPERHKMSKLGTVKFSGKSGTRYAFTAYPLQTVFVEGLGGVYVITRRREGNCKSGFVHRRICSGQSEDLRQPLPGGAQGSRAKGANCICVHAEKDEVARLAIELDLFRKPPIGRA
jgi:hypothetical protein